MLHSESFSGGSGKRSTIRSAPSVKGRHHLTGEYERALTAYYATGVAD